jgi:hypothetical protein
MGVAAPAALASLRGIPNPMTKAPAVSPAEASKNRRREIFTGSSAGNVSPAIDESFNLAIFYLL